MKNLLKKDEIVGKEIKEIKTSSSLDIYIFDSGVYIKDFRNRDLDENNIMSVFNLDELLELNIIGYDEYNSIKEEEKRKYIIAQQKRKELEIKRLEGKIQDLEYEIKQCYGKIEMTKGE